MPESTEKKKGWGGPRPGSGRPKGSTKGNLTRNVTMSKELWRLVDERLAASGQKRVDFFEALVRKALL